MLSCHTRIHASFVFVYTVLFTYPWQVCCSSACVHALCWSLIKFPIEGFIIFSRQKRENYKPINPCVWSSSPLLPRRLMPSLFDVSRPLFTRFSSGPPFLCCWEVICLYVRAVLSPRLSYLAPPNLSAPHHHPDMWASEVLRSGIFCVYGFYISLSIRDIYIHVCLYWPCLTAPIFYCYFVNTCLASEKVPQRADVESFRLNLEEIKSVPFITKPLVKASVL